MKLWWLVLLVACHADRPAHPEHPTVIKLRKFRDRACACKDKPCADTVEDDFVMWTNTDREPAPTGADATAADAIRRQFDKCIRDASNKL